MAFAITFEMGYGVCFVNARTIDIFFSNFVNFSTSHAEAFNNYVDRVSCLHALEHNDDGVMMRKDVVAFEQAKRSASRHGVVYSICRLVTSVNEWTNEVERLFWKRQWNTTSVREREGARPSYSLALRCSNHIIFLCYYLLLRIENMPRGS